MITLPSSGQFKERRNPPESAGHLLKNAALLIEHAVVFTTYLLETKQTSCLLRISSEDSGDVPSYTEDSDDSLDLDIDSSNPGQMNLLAEILDSLNTSTLEQGKLSAAKSLDFFRSMEDLDYTGPVRQKTHDY